jgi:hypothetical protein
MLGLAIEVVEKTKMGVCRRYCIYNVREWGMNANEGVGD